VDAFGTQCKCVGLFIVQLNSTQRGSIDAGVKHLYVHIYLLSSHTIV